MELIVGGTLIGSLLIFLIVRDRFRTPEERKKQRDRAKKSGSGDPFLF